MTSLFISYSRKDIDPARQLAEAFERQNLDIWIDWEEIPPTVDWWKEVEKGIEEADAFLFLLSPDSLVSNVCKQELEHAVKNGKRLIPVVVRDIKADESPPALRHLNWIFFRPGDDFDQSFSKLITALKTDYDWVQIHRQLQVKALEWERNNHENSFLLRGKELQDAELQLARNAAKEPVATALQREYVLKSRQVTDKERRIITTIAVAGAILMAILAVFGFVQANLANERARIAHLQELAAQSALLRDRRPQTSLLLGLEVFRQLGSNPQTLGLLLDNVQSHPQVRQFLVGHSDAVNSVAVSPECASPPEAPAEWCGKVIASGSADHTIILWDAMTYRPIGEPLMGHLASVNSVAFSPDGKTLASGSDDGTVILWEVQTHQQLGTPLSGHAGPVTSVAFSPDGRILASGSADQTIFLWDTGLHERIGRPLLGHTGSVNCLAFRPDGKTLASGSADKTILLWDLETYQPIDAGLTGHLGSVDSLAFSPDGTILLSGSIDTRIIVWDVSARQQIGRPLAQHGSRVNGLAFSPDGKMFASGSNDSTIILWDTATYKPIHAPLTGHIGAINSVVFSADGQTLISGSADSNLILWDVFKSYPISRVLRPNARRINSVAFSPECASPPEASAERCGKILAWGALNNTVTLADADSLQLIGVPLAGHSESVESVAFNPDGTLLASGSADNTIVLWDVETHEPAGPPLAGHTGSVNSVTFNPDGTLLASGSADHTILLWDVETHEPAGPPLTGHSSSVNSVAFSPDGKTLASGSSDGTVDLWDLTVRPPVSKSITGYSDAVYSVAFSPECVSPPEASAERCGKILAFGNLDGTIVLWDITAQKMIGGRLIGHSNLVKTLAFSPNGEMLASGGFDGDIILWDVTARQPIGQPLVGHTGGVFSLAFKPDGRLLASGSVDNTIRVWTLDPQVWFEQTCQQVGRNFTQEEWIQYFPDQSYPHENLTCPQWQPAQ